MNKNILLSLSNILYEQEHIVNTQIYSTNKNII